ncbi:hypothetical protein BDZ45DRAFT_252225 [Acephala macrosclerotiorum]|nr:hypothetical protein BDZ45DRAFT_252225 [Acephala macrosclerotiorum]
MARDPSRRPSGSSSTEDGTSPKARLRDDGLGTGDEARLLDTSLDAEIAALRDSLPQSMPGASTVQVPDTREADPIRPQDPTSAHLHDQVVILSNALRYIRHLESRVQLLRQENTALGLEKIISTWRIMTLVNNGEHMSSSSPVDSQRNNPSARGD